MTYEWDENKNLANKKKHDGIGFETAVRVFLDEKRIEKIRLSSLNRKGRPLECYWPGT